MKVEKIGDFKVNICEHKSDINIGRFTMVKQYSPLIWEKMDIPLCSQFFQRAKDLFNQGDHWGGLQVFSDYMAAIQQFESKRDPWEIIFALITFEDGEDQTRMDEAFLEDKVKKYIKAGLTADLVYDSVQGFFQKSPEAFSEVLIQMALTGFVQKQSGSEK